MTKRREFSRSVYVEIVKRATINAVIRCEKCRVAVSRFEVQHVREDALEIDKSAKLTVGDGLLLCKPCHDELTRPFQTVIAKVKRIEAKHTGFKKGYALPPASPAHRATRPVEKTVARRPIYCKDA